MVRVDDVAVILSISSETECGVMWYKSAMHEYVRKLDVVYCMQCLELDMTMSMSVIVLGIACEGKPRLLGRATNINRNSTSSSILRRRQNTPHLALTRAGDVCPRARRMHG